STLALAGCGALALLSLRRLRPAASRPRAQQLGAAAEHLRLKHSNLGHRSLGLACADLRPYRRCFTRSALLNMSYELRRHVAFAIYGVLVALLLNVEVASAAKIWDVGDLVSYPQGNWGGDPTIDPIYGLPLDAGAGLLVDEFNSLYAATSGVIVGSASG